jgi:peptidoglycan/LPS O-acetylase OafA/YrhL
MVIRRNQSMGRFHTLDGIRGIAALAVVLYHFGLKTNRMVPLGYLAVDLFFALSGFVIAWNYEAVLINGRTGPGAFMRMRLIRLYPLYAIGFFVGLLKQLVRVAGVGGDAPLRGIWLALGVLLGIVVLPTPLREGQIFPLNPPSWSLFIELLVNILFALMLVRFSSRILLLIAAVALVGLAWIQSAPYFLDLGWSMTTLAGGVGRVMLSFPIGMVLCRWGRSVERRTTWLALLPPLLVIVVLCITASDRRLPMLELADVVLVFPAILVAGIVWEPPSFLIKPFAFLGDISYPMYILHSSFTFIFIRIMRWTSMPPLGAGLLFVSVMALIAAAVAHFYDRPVRGWLNRRVHARFSAPEQIL